MLFIFVRIFLCSARRFNQTPNETKKRAEGHESCQVVWAQSMKTTTQELKKQQSQSDLSLVAKVIPKTTLNFEKTSQRKCKEDYSTVTRDEGVLGKCTPSHTRQKWTFWHAGDCQAICSNLKSQFASKMQPRNPPNHLHYHNTDIWCRDKAWLTSHLEPNMAPGHDCDEVVPWSEPCNLRASEFDWIIPWKLIVSISTARLCSDPNVFSPSAPQHFSHWFGETIGILPSTGIATRRTLCRKLRWVCERLTSDVWILCSWDLEVQLYGVFECVRQNLFCRICCQHDPVVLHGT